MLNLMAHTQKIVNKLNLNYLLAIYNKTKHREQKERGRKNKMGVLYLPPH